MASRRASATAPAQNLDRESRFASCRSMGHEWTHRQAVGTDDTADGFKRPFGASTGMVGLPSHCQTCGTHRMRWVTRSGEVVTRYEHPDGYSRHGDDRLRPQEWRSMYVETLFAAFTEAVSAAPRRANGRKRA